MGRSLDVYLCFTSVLVSSFLAPCGSRRFSVGGALGSWRSRWLEWGSVCELIVTYLTDLEYARGGCVTTAVVKSVTMCMLRSQTWLLVAIYACYRCSCRAFRVGKFFFILQEAQWERAHFQACQPTYQCFTNLVSWICIKPFSRYRFSRFRWFACVVGTAQWKQWHCQSRDRIPRSPYLSQCGARFLFIESVFTLQTSQW